MRKSDQVSFQVFSSADFHSKNSFFYFFQVKNVSFKKDVFVRCSFNGWETFSDFPAKYHGKSSEAGGKYDTFSFEIAISARTDEKHTIEFCIGVRTDGTEYWDSNSGLNYQLITSHLKQKKAADKNSDAYAIHNLAGSWSQFASWNHLDLNQPYY
jgi:protein phosphatase 1 regulatory subunit 3A/B/C/D/E